MKLGRALRYARHYRNWLELSRARDAGRKPGAVELRDGSRFEAPDDTNVLRVVAGVFLHRYYTPPGWEIASGDVVVDVGANIGAYTVWAAQRTRGRVLAVEPHPENVRYLKRNVIANGVENVEVLECALADRPGSLRLYRGQSGTTHQLFADGKNARAHESIEVRATTLAAVLEERGVDGVDLLKLDCEGAEGLILPTAPAAVLSRVRRIALEFHDDTSPVDHAGLASLLEERGFRTRLRWDGASPNGFLYATR